MKPISHISVHPARHFLAADTTGNLLSHPKEVAALRRKLDLCVLLILIFRDGFLFKEQ
jgi:hypothetical protein